MNNNLCFNKVTYEKSTICLAQIKTNSNLNRSTINPFLEKKLPDYQV